MAKKACGQGACKQIRDNKSIYHPSWKSSAGKGDQPRKTSQEYQKNYDSIFPNAFKPKWQIEVEEDVEDVKKDTQLDD